MSNDYEKAYEAGRRGEIYTGGNSIDYAGHTAGDSVRRQAESQASSGGGGGGAINFKGKVMTFAIGFGMIGMFWGFISETTWTGGIIGFLVAGVFGAIVRLSVAGLALIARFLPVLVWTGMGLFIGAVYGAGPARHAIGAYAVVGAVIGLGVWFVTRLLKKR